MKSKIISISLLLLVITGISGCTRSTINAPTPTTTINVTIGQ